MDDAQGLSWSCSYLEKVWEVRKKSLYQNKPLQDLQDFKMFTEMCFLKVCRGTFNVVTDTDAFGFVYRKRHVLYI